MTAGSSSSRASSDAPHTSQTPSFLGGSESTWKMWPLVQVRRPPSRRELVEAVWAASWPHDRLVLGASRLIREADDVVPGKKLRVHANRGLAGIDGTVATAIGIALASQAGEARGTTRLLLGDLALLHDTNGLLVGPTEERPPV